MTDTAKSNPELQDLQKAHVQKIQEMLAGLPIEIIMVALPAFKNVSRLEARMIALIGAHFAKRGTIDVEDTRHVVDAIDFLYLHNDFFQRPTEEGVLEVTYEALRDKQLTWAAAARLASAALGQSIKPDAWRKRVEKWRTAKELPPVEQRKRAKPA